MAEEAHGDALQDSQAHEVPGGRATHVVKQPAWLSPDDFVPLQEEQESNDVRYDDVQDDIRREVGNHR